MNTIASWHDVISYLTLVNLKISHMTFVTHRQRQLCEKYWLHQDWIWEEPIGGEKEWEKDIKSFSTILDTDKFFDKNSFWRQLLTGTLKTISKNYNYVKDAFIQKNSFIGESNYEKAMRSIALLHAIACNLTDSMNENVIILM